MTKELNDIFEENLENLIVTAIEGGSNYWYWLTKEATDIIRENATDNTDPLSVKLCRAIESGHIIPIHKKSDKTEVGAINMASAKNAFKKLHNNYPERSARVITGGYDANDADVWFQLAVMNKIVFG
ncbi:hypothetical protein ACKGJO_06835 [Gracilimonas sp. Q87]|uniref:hypothetical protein n=1 Tax=Gracilimonas sp. Q87 TaxID=3384766 RepID=UPI00398457B1